MTRAIAAFVVLWPLAQLVLVHAAHTNPWRLMGFAMYTTEHDIRVTLKKRDPAGQTLEVEPHELPPEARAAYDDFVARRVVLGRLCSPASFVETWRRVDARLAGVAVEVDIEVLRLKHARMTPIARESFSL